MNDGRDSNLHRWLVFGQAAEPSCPLALRAGPLQLLYEPWSGFVRHVRLGEREVLRGIYAAVRDCNWGTIPPVITETVRSVNDDSFHIEFEAVHRQENIHFLWHGSIRGHADGTLLYQFEGRARSGFLHNRIGFCVLHPIRECAGAAARQTRTDGLVVECRFSDRIEPQLIGKSTFRNLSAVAHEISAGVWADVQFSGEVFEMEDQRNWTDASFKTYSTPLEKPFPTLMKAGTAVEQSVTLRLAGPAPRIGVHSGIAQEARLVLDLSKCAESQRRALDIGLSLPGQSQPLSPTEVDRLRALRLAHVRCDIKLADSHWVSDWERALQAAKQLGARLELAVHLPRKERGELAACSGRVLIESQHIARVLALRTSEPATSRETLEMVRRALAPSKLPIGAGSDANFCELNREQALGRVPLAGADFLFWPMNPQVHATDHASILETLEGQPDSLMTARSFALGKPLVVSPLTLKPRFNAVATMSSTPVRADGLPPSVDSRQFSLFAGAWTLGSLAALSAAGAVSVTLFETIGPRGVIEHENIRSWPSSMPDLRNCVFPVYHLLAELAGVQEWAPYAPGPDRACAALSIKSREEGTRVLLANLKDEPQDFRLTGLLAGIPTVRVRILDETNVSAALSDPVSFQTRTAELKQDNGEISLHLSPYAIAFVMLDVV